MVEGLGEKFEEEREELEKKEMNEKHAHDMLMQDLTDQIESAAKSREKKASFKAEQEAASAQSKGDLADTTSTKAEDEKFLADLTSECESKAIEFEQNQETRAGELEAINKAIEIMSSDKVSGAGAKHLPGLVQVGTSLAQLRTVSKRGVQGLAASFKKVTKMIKDMIQKLMEEAAEEAEHKGFCDTEM